MHILVLGGTFPCFLHWEGAKEQFWATFSTMVSNGNFLFHNWEEYGKLKKGFQPLSDYIHPKFGGGRLNSHGETLAQIGVR